jgi:hypothetical protein
VSPRIASPRPDWKADSNLFATENAAPRQYVSQLPHGNNNAVAERPGAKSSKELDLERIVMGLKKDLLRSQENLIKNQGTIRRLESTVAKCIKDNAALVSASSGGGGGSAAHPGGGSASQSSKILKIAVEIEKSEVVRRMRVKVDQLTKQLADKDRHISGIMRSANATGLLEMAAARDEYYREVLRLQSLLKEANDDRDRLGAAVEKISSKMAAKSNRVEVEEKKVDEGQQQEAEMVLGSNDVDALKSLVRAQQSRIKDLRTKLAGGDGGGGGSNNRNPSPRKNQLLRDRGSIIRKLANGHDLAGQAAAKGRVDKKVKEEKREEKERLRKVQVWLDGEEGGGGGGTGREEWMD